MTAITTASRTPAESALNRVNVPGMPEAQVRDVAARAGVSPATVSNALNHPDKVSPATRERVHAAIAELGFVRNSAAHHCAAAPTAPSGWSCSTSPTRSSPTWPAASRTGSPSRADP